MGIPVLSDLIFTGGAKIDGLPNATTLQQPATYAQLRDAFNGLSWKDNCRTISTGNVSLTNPGASMNGVTLVNGNRVLLHLQTDSTENGIYIWTGAAIALTRAPDASTYDALENAVVMVDEGSSNAGTRWRQTGLNGTLGTNNVTFVSDQTAVPSASETTPGIAEIATQAETDAGTDDLRMITPKKLKDSPLSQRTFVQTIGDGSTTTFSLAHNFNTYDIDVVVKEATGSRRGIIVEWDTSDLNTARVIFATAPASNSYRAMVERLA